MDPEFPDYNASYPVMDGDWRSDTSFELGWIAGLHRIANESLVKIYGNYSEFTIPDDFGIEFDPNTITEGNAAPIVYLAVWIAVLVVFAITGLCWCICNKCVCCCRSSFKGRSGRSVDELENTDPHYQLRPYYSERNASKSGGITFTVIIMSLLMVVWLIGLLIVILHTFAANDKTKQAVESIQPDLDNAFHDLDIFLSKAREQLNFTFKGGFDKLEPKIKDIVDACAQCSIIPPGQDKSPEEIILAAIKNARDEVSASTEQLDDALVEVQQAIRDEKANVEDDYKETIDNVNKALYWFFMLFNLLYCLIFLLVLIGVVLAGFSRQSGMKTFGFIIIRGGIVLMFITGILVILQMLTMFTIAGAAGEIICPAIRDLENENRDISRSANASAIIPFQITSAPPDYVVPTAGYIIRACKNGKSSYMAFDLHNAYDLAELGEIVDYFDLPLPMPIPEVAEVQNQVRKYVDFVGVSLKNDMGICTPAYVAINATVSLFCDKITAPVASYWFILQFLLPIFILIFITAMFFERMHS